jgi:sulfur carrier protein
MTATTSSTRIDLTLNGEQVDARPGTTIADLLRQRGRDPETPGVAVARNGRVIRRKEWAETVLEDGDALEVITAFQGG